jgi:predicted negative regulator of RcsB-dependent stress response
MADTEKPGRKKVILTVVGVVFVLIIAAGAGFGLRMTQNKHKTDVSTGSPSLPQVVSDAQDLRLQGNTDEANKKIDAALNDSSTSKEVRYDLLIQKGATLNDQKNYAAAADVYAQAAATTPTSSAYEMMGDAYAAAGQKDKAIEAYKKAIPLLPSSPVQEDDKASLEYKIRELGGDV